MPDIKLATTDVSAMKLGTTNVTKVYLGATQIWSSAAGTDVLLEPFNNLTAWTQSGTPTIVTGRTGTALQVTGATNGVRYAIPAPSESDTITIGFAYRATVVTAASRRVLSLWSDTNTTEHIRLDLSGSDFRLTLLRGSVGSLGVSAAGVVVTNTWCYIETQVKLHDTTGFGIVRVNGTEVINVSGVDTKNLGTKTTFDGLRLNVSLASNNAQYDDLYLTTGVGAAFKGDITIP